MLAVRVLQGGDATQPRVAEAVEEVGALVEPGQAGEFLVLGFGERGGQRQGQVSCLRLRGSRGGVALPVRRTHALRGTGSTTGALGLLTGGHGGSHPAQGTLLEMGTGGGGGGRQEWGKKTSQLIKFTFHIKILLSLKAKQWRHATRPGPHSQLVSVRSEGKSIHHHFCSRALSSSDWDGKFSASLVEEILPCTTTL